MQNSATKIIKFILNKKNVEKLYRNLSKQTVIPIILLSVLLIFSYYFLKPYFYKYNSNIKVIEKKIKEEFKLDIKINGKISYNFLPSPRIKIKKSELNLNNKKNPILLEEINILIPVLNNKKIKNIIISDIDCLFLKVKKLTNYASNVKSIAAINYRSELCIDKRFDNLIKDCMAN